jgi:hypothetical protein
MHDQPRRQVEHLAREMEVLRPVLPQRRDALVEHGVRQKPADNSALPLHRVEVAVPVTTTDRQPRDEMVQDEVVQHDDSRRAPQRRTIHARPGCCRCVERWGGVAWGFFRAGDSDSQRACSAGSSSAEQSAMPTARGIGLNSATFIACPRAGNGRVPCGDSLQALLPHAALSAGGTTIDRRSR